MDLFSQEQALIFLKMLVAHLIGDFVLQPKNWVINKLNKGLKGYGFYAHIAVIAILTSISLEFKYWELIFLIITFHAIIDYWKLRVDISGNIKYFLIDQILHLSVLIFVWIYLIQDLSYSSKVISGLWNSFTIQIITSGYLFCIFPSSYIIGLATKGFGGAANANLPGGGRLIGIFERIIIFTLVLLSQYEAIGFLITGKSILRFADAQRRESEYLLAGTMMSYALAIMTGVIVNVLLGKYI